MRCELEGRGGRSEEGIGGCVVKGGPEDRMGILKVVECSLETMWV